MIEFSEIFLSRGRTGKDMQLAGNAGSLILGTVHFLKTFIKPKSFVYQTSVFQILFSRKT